jgi:hypothetical protein
VPERGLRRSQSRAAGSTRDGAAVAPRASVMIGDLTLAACARLPAERKHRDRQPRGAPERRAVVSTSRSTAR